MSAVDGPDGWPRSKILQSIAAYYYAIFLPGIFKTLGSCASVHSAFDSPAKGCCWLEDYRNGGGEHPFSCQRHGINCPLRMDRCPKKTVRIAGIKKSLT